ncbi:hypothetical protein [Algoriphagus hitonicola]|uniref:Outer membrane protein beta-barrel domain-containing protein n=1 Tax=Algoriphagus hitonicola TaxID=435880 RepID=A0A1I2NPL4_9BACT|nr:hypothetical protein [Algoriphagus hitonicola]SFG03221.1 hypothetical protein SAMN04487988_101128 [Algoriphagus hitonicola]
MGRLKFILIACLAFLAGHAVFSQDLKVGFGLVDERVSNGTFIEIDTVSVYEQTNYSTSDPMPYVRFDYPFSDRFSGNIGFQFHKKAIALAVEYTSETWSDPLQSLGKGGGTGMYLLEFPIGGSYKLIDKEHFDLMVDLSAVPVWVLPDPIPLNVEPQGIDWTQEIIDALNAAQTIPKSFYMNYQYGLSAEYKRFGLTLFRTANMNRSISNGYTLYGQQYNFPRRTRSTRIGLYYTFGM